MPWPISTITGSLMINPGLLLICAFGLPLLVIAAVAGATAPKVRLLLLGAGVAAIAAPLAAWAWNTATLPILAVVAGGSVALAAGAHARPMPAAFVAMFAGLAVLSSPVWFLFLFFTT